MIDSLGTTEEEPEVEEIEEEPDKTELMRVIQSLSDTLLKKRDEAVEFRAASGVERQWREDEDIFDGIDEVTSGRTRMLDYVTGEAPAKDSGPSRSKVVVNIVRGKCETAEGRFSDIQLPTDDKNWGLQPTPVPEISKALKDKRQAAQNGQPLQSPDGKPITVSDVATLSKKQIEERMTAMEQQIDDQLTECKYNAESRKLIASAVRLGTGIMKGPNVVKSIKKVWAPDESGQWAMSTEEEMQPASKWVSCWNVYPDPDVGEDIRKAAYIWEYESILPRELRNLIGVDGYFDDEIIKVLTEEPKRMSVGFNEKNKKHQIQRSTAARGDQYERWDYYGDLNREDLEALGVDLSHDEVSQSFSACCVFVNDRPIKVFLNALSTGDMPYDFFTWTSVSGSPWGIGIPRMLIWLQRIITAAWRSTMDNSGDSSGANIVVGPGITPADGKWEITGKKIWYMDDSEIDDVRKSFQQFQIINTQPQLQAVIELALKFVDMETSLPMMFQGEKAEAPETLGATNIMVDANNVALRSRVKRYDDMVTVPHLTRYYHYNMEYSDKEEIKGDYNVDARGTSVLLQKDQQAQTLMQVMAAKQDPDINLLVDWEKAARQMFAAMRLDILKSDEDYDRAVEERKQQQQPQDPKIQAAQMKVQGEMEKAKLVQQSDMAEIKAKGQMSQTELQHKAQEAQLEREHDRAMQEMALQVKMMDFSNAKGISLDKIKADLMKDSMRLKTQIALTQKDGSAPQVSTPPMEPPARARAGHAYTE